VDGDFKLWELNSILQLQGNLDSGAVRGKSIFPTDSAGTSEIGSFEPSREVAVTA
jgi:hypothetical protein